MAVHYGVTVDLNDSGMALVAYEELPLNSVLRFTIRGAGEVVKLRRSPLDFFGIRQSAIPRASAMGSNSRT